MHILLYFLITLHVMVCVLMVLVVLMQRPRSEGLGAAFGSGMTENIFGAQTTHVLAKFTTWLGGAFFLLTLALAMVYSHIYNKGGSSMERQLSSLPAPAASATPTPAPVATPVPAQTLTPAATVPAAATATPAQPVAPLAPATPIPATPAPQAP